jgi:hypothetical protein
MTADVVLRFSGESFLGTEASRAGLILLASLVV